VLDGMNAERNDHDADTEFDGFAVIRHSVPFGLLSEGIRPVKAVLLAMGNCESRDYS